MLFVFFAGFCLCESVCLIVFVIIAGLCVVCFCFVGWVVCFRLFVVLLVLFVWIVFVCLLGLCVVLVSSCLFGSVVLCICLFYTFGVVMLNSVVLFVEVDVC